MPNYWPVGGGGGVTSFNGRTGAVMPAAGDYTAAQVTNAVDQTQVYANPPWISSLAFSKITGVPSNFGLWQSGGGGVIYYNGGNVGIGVSTPWSLLHVRKSVSSVGGPFTADTVMFAESASNAYCELAAGVNNICGLILGSNAQTNAVNLTDQFDGTNHILQLSANYPGSYIVFRCAGLERVRIANSGFVGIGVAPQAPLHVAGSATQTSVLFGNSAGPNSLDFLTLPASATLADNGISSNLFYNGSAWTLRNVNCEGWLFAMNATNPPTGTSGLVGVFHAPPSTTNTLVACLVIPSSGNVGVGTAAPAYKIDISGDCNIAAGGVYRIGGTQVSPGLLLSATATADMVLTTTVQPVPGTSVTISRAGTYLVSGVVDFAGSGAGDVNSSLVCYLQVNGTNQSTAIVLTLGAANDRATVTQQWPVSLTAGQVLQLAAFKTAGTGSSSLVHNDTTIAALWVSP